MRIRSVAFPSRIKGRVKNSHLLDHDYLAQAPDTEATMAECTHTKATMTEHGYSNPKSPDVMWKAKDFIVWRLDK